MKKIAVMCLIASLTFASGSMTVLASSASSQNNEISAELNETAADTAGEDITYPSDWDPDDPQNARAYKQIYSDSDSDDLWVLARSAGESMRNASVQTSWTVYNEDGSTRTKTFVHSDFNTSGKNVIPVIDVSYHNGNIDWNQVKASGVQCVMIRAGYRGYASGTIASNGDSKFQTYIRDAQAAGLKVGIYFFSQAITTQEAVEEAEWTLNKISGYKIDLPVAIDYEYSGAEGERLNSANLSRAEKTACIRAFCDKVKAAGYQSMVYASSSWLKDDIETEYLRSNGIAQIWLARYNTHSYADGESGKYGGQIDFWQCSSEAYVRGISTKVDLDYWYQPVTSAMQGAVEKNEETGQYEYRIDGVLQKDYTGVAPAKDAWYRVENGIVNFSYTGISNNQNGWWYVKDGKVQFDYTGIVENENGRWRVEDGQVNFSYNGITNDQNGWWKFSGGKVDTSYTGVSNNELGWWRIENGKVNFEYTGISNNANGWWYLKDGKVQFDYTGIKENENGRWRILAGQVDFNYNSITNDQNGWWKFSGGKVDTSYTGVSNNELGWWRIENGKVNFEYTGISNNANGWWYLKDGKVQFDFTGWIKASGGNYYVEKGRVK